MNKETKKNKIISIKREMILRSETVSGDGEINEAGNWKVITNTDKTIVLELVKEPNTIWGEIFQINENVGSRLSVKKDNSGQHVFKQWSDGSFTIYPFRGGTPLYFEIIKKEVI